MAEDPCKKLHDDYVAAMNEWVAASAAAQNWASTRPLSLTEDITPHTLAQSEQMGRDFDRERAAKEDYFRKMDAYLKCRQAHPYHQ